MHLDKPTLSVTPAQIRAWDACYSDAQILKLWDGREALTPRQISELDIPNYNRVWALIRCLPIRDMPVFARWCADRAPHAADADADATWAAKQLDQEGDAAEVVYFTSSAACDAAYSFDDYHAERRSQITELLRMLESYPAAV